MLKEQALHYYEQGYNCAESLVYGTNAALKLNLDENACHLMAGLGGGLQVGDVCGALTGAVCALGCLIVKTKAHDCPELKPLTQAVWDRCAVMKLSRVFFDRNAVVQRRLKTVRMFWKRF